jgi:hypothetical protein
MHWARLSGGVAITCAIAIWSPAVCAADPGTNDPQVIESARYEFAEGTTHYQRKRWADALRSFEQSFSHVDSPNTELMIARCLRELGRTPEAAAVFSSAEANARRRLTAGEAKYRETADTAASEGAAVRAKLGTLQIHVAHPSGSTLMVDNKTVPLSKDGDATLFHEPGTASVVVSGARKAEQRQTVTVQAAATIKMEFAGQEAEPERPSPAPPTPPVPPMPREKPASSSSKPSWPIPAALVSGVVTLAGTAVFIGFGADSQSTFEALRDRCGPSSCGPDDRNEAETGERKQTLANIGLGVGIAGAVATLVFVVIAMMDR